MQSAFQLSKLQVECTMFFQENPYAFETIEGLAVKLGRNMDDLRPVIKQLVSNSILEAIGEGEQTIYRYNEPYLLIDDKDSQWKRI